MKKRKRWTIGFLIDYTDSQYQFTILQGIMDCVKKHDINLLCFEGGILDGYRNFDRERNIIYNLVTGTRVDGVLILSDTVTYNLDQDMFLQFSSKFHPLPVVCIGRSHKDIHSIVIDSTDGMREMTEHLITKHHLHKFAFIKGLNSSYEAHIRFEVFCKVLSEHSIPLHPELVFEGDYQTMSGKRVVDVLFDNLYADVDVIVASNDQMASGAIMELKNRGIDIPHDIAVVGFDDISQSTMINPPLTTVRQPLHKEGWTAVEILLNLLNNKEANMRIELKSGIIIRETCGCKMLENQVDPVLNKKNRKESYNTLQGFHIEQCEHDQIVSRITGILNKIYYDTTWMEEKDLADNIVENYYLSRENGDKDIFVSFWKSFLNSVLRIERDALLIQEILISIFSIHVSKTSTTQYDRDLYYISHGILKDAVIQAIKDQNYKTQKEAWIINSLHDELQINLNTSEITEVLNKKLSELGISTSYVAFFDISQEKLMSNARLILAIRDHKRHPLPEKGLEFPVTQITPDQFYPDTERFSFIIESLNYTSNHYGFILFDMGENLNSIYGNLRRVISNVLNGKHLITQIEDQRNELIKTVSKLRTIMGGVIQTLASTVEIRDPYTAGHQRRVSDLSRAIAYKLSLPPDEIEGIRLAGIVHDIGKIFIPSEILNKPGKLMDIEFALIKHHPRAGCDILKKIDFPWPIADIVLQHHERCDGSGYPSGLTRDKILLQARILSVADVVEAITSLRPYRAALGIEVAFEEISKFKGIWYEPDVVDACLSLFMEDGFKFKDGVK